jgi:predicted nucleic acid-binding protein
MSGGTAYVDTSAFVKLIVAEPESDLSACLKRWPNGASATLVRTEAARALRRSGNDHLLGKARRLVRAIHFVREWLDRVHVFCIRFPAQTSLRTAHSSRVPLLKGSHRPA